MFTGIIEEVGHIRSVRHGAASALLTIEAPKILRISDVHDGDSIAVNGVCLTVTTHTACTFTADVMHETLIRSCLGKLQPGHAVNLEPAMPAGGRFGGHLVSGHIDGTGIITHIQQDDIAIWYTISTDAKILRYIIEKGSIAIDGISLTVTAIHRDRFQVSVIPHTAACTTLSQKRMGDLVNLENDLIAKYVEKLLSAPQTASTDAAGPTEKANPRRTIEDNPGQTITKQFLQEYSF